MDTFEAISTRRAIKKFDSDYKMTSEQIDSLMKLTILSPTSYNQQNWRFVTIADQSYKRKKLELPREIKHNLLTDPWLYYCVEI